MYCLDYDIPTTYVADIMYFEDENNLVKEEYLCNLRNFRSVEK